MSQIYDNWEKLVDAVVKREQYRKLAYAESFRSSFGSDSDFSDCSASTSSRRFSFDLSSPDQPNEQAPHGGNYPSFASTSSANASIFNHVPKPPKMPSGSRFGKIFGAARRFVTPARKRPETRIINLPQEIRDAHVLSYNELKKQTGNFGPRALIAEGIHVKVYFARLKSGKDVTLMMLDVSFELYWYNEFLKELSTVSRFKHENVVEFLGYCIENDCCILAYEFATLGSLHNLLHGRGSTVTGGQTSHVLDWMQRVRIAVDAAKGLEYLHDNGTIHKDIRSTNVLLFNDFKAKIADIDLSTKDPDDSVSVNGDPLYYAIRLEQHPGFGYNAPESGKAGKLTQKSDVYSFGVVLLELLTGRKSFDKTLPKGHQNLVTWATPKLSEDKVKGCVDPKLMGEYPPKAAAKLAQVAALCVQYEAKHRPDMRIVVKALQPLLRSPAPGS